MAILQPQSTDTLNSPDHSFLHRVVGIDNSAPVQSLVINGAGEIIVGKWQATDIGVEYGGSSRSSATAYAVICGGTTSTGAHQSIVSIGTSGQVLISNGDEALPTFQNLSIAGLAPDTATTQATQANITTCVNLTTVGTLVAGNATAIVDAATLTGAGKIEIATVAETSTGTDATRAISPDGLAGSKFGERAVQMVVFDFTTDVVTGDGKFYFHIDSRLDGMNLVDVHAEVITAGTTGTTDIQIHNLTQTADMLSTVITIDSGETGSDTAATPAVIDTGNDDVAENDVIRVDVDAVSTTEPKGLLITLGFRLP